MDIIKVKAQARDAAGKKGAKAVRNEGLIPAVIYGGGENVNIKLDARDMKPLIYTPDFKLAELDVDGKSERCIVKQVDFHPVTDEIVHIDFLRLVEDTPIKVEIPVRFKGKSPGVKAGGKLIQMVRRVGIKAMPKNLVDELYVDISSLELGQSVRVRDIELKDNMELMVNGAIPVASIEIPRALRSAAAAEAKAAK